MVRKFKDVVRIEKEVFGEADIKWARDLRNFLKYTVMTLYGNKKMFKGVVVRKWLIKK